MSDPASDDAPEAEAAAPGAAAPGPEAPEPEAPEPEAPEPIRRSEASEPGAPPPPEQEAPLPDLAYEQARDELVDVVRKLEAGGTTLEESLALWERGEYLAGVCETWLEGARARLRTAVGDNEE